MTRKLAPGVYRLYSRKKNPKTGKRRNLGSFPFQELQVGAPRAIRTPDLQIRSHLVASGRSIAYLGWAAVGFTGRAVNAGRMDVQKLASLW